MRLQKRGGRWKGSAVVRAPSEVGGNAVILFILPARERGTAYYIGGGVGGGGGGKTGKLLKIARK